MNGCGQGFGMSDAVNDPRFWRDRAEQTRVRAEGFRVSEIDKQRLLKIASEYDHIADRAEQWRTASEAEQRK